MNKVILDIEDYDRLKAYDEAAKNSYDIKINIGYGPAVIYMLKTESELIHSLEEDIRILQIKIKELQEEKYEKRKWFKL